jgi:hypothetical protein
LQAADIPEERLTGNPHFTASGVQTWMYNNHFRQLATSFEGSSWVDKYWFFCYPPGLWMERDGVYRFVILDSYSIGAFEDETKPCRFDLWALPTDNEIMPKWPPKGRDNAHMEVSRY